jgi:LysR family transcriptional regulator, transcriptional activator for bauABCD operon
LLIEERQALLCGREHPLFGRAELNGELLQGQDGVHHPYRFIGADEPWQTSARSGQVEGTLAFILSGAHIGYLPRHIAAPSESRGRLRALLPDVYGFTVQFHLASHRGRQPSEAQQAFVTDLMAAFA